MVWRKTRDFLTVYYVWVQHYVRAPPMSKRQTRGCTRVLHDVPTRLSLRRGKRKKNSGEHISHKFVRVLRLNFSLTQGTGKTYSTVLPEHRSRRTEIIKCVQKGRPHCDAPPYIRRRCHYHGRPRRSPPGRLHLRSPFCRLAPRASWGRAPSWGTRAPLRRHRGALLGCHHRPKENVVIVQPRSAATVSTTTVSCYGYVWTTRTVGKIRMHPLIHQHTPSQNGSLVRGTSSTTEVALDASNLKYVLRTMTTYIILHSQ